MYPPNSKQRHCMISTSTTHSAQGRKTTHHSPQLASIENVHVHVYQDSRNVPCLVVLLYLAPNIHKKSCTYTCPPYLAAYPWITWHRRNGFLFAFLIIFMVAVFTWLFYSHPWSRPCVYKPLLTSCDDTVFVKDQCGQTFVADLLCHQRLNRVHFRHLGSNVIALARLESCYRSSVRVLGA